MDEAIEKLNALAVNARRNATRLERQAREERIRADAWESAKSDLINFSRPPTGMPLPSHEMSFAHNAEANANARDYWTPGGASGKPC